jgi:hypothetical protein
VSAPAHHPGSHASRQPDGRVRVQVVTRTADSCTDIADILVGPPPGLSAVPGSSPVTARLRRRSGTCESVVTAVRAEQVLQVPQDVRQIHLFVAAPDGRVLATERVPIEPK